MLRTRYVAISLLILSCVSWQIARAQSSTPAWRWAQGFRTHQYNGPADLAVDDVGNTYLAGTFDTYLPLGPGTTLTPQSGADGFLAKFSPTGTLLWAQQLRGLNGRLNKLKLIPATSGGRLYLSGVAAVGAVSINTQTLPIATRDDCVFTACFDTQGQLQWLRPLASLGGSTSVYDLELDAAGNLYLLGTVQGTVALGNAISLTTGPDKQLFWAKFSPTGTALWARQALLPTSVNHEVVATDLSVSPAGDALYLLGDVNDLITTFAGLTLGAPKGFMDVLVTKCDGQGQPRWTYRSGGQGGYNYAGGAALDAAGHLAVGFTFQGTLTLASTTFTAPAGNYRAAVQVLDSAGIVQWAQALTQNLSSAYYDEHATGVLTDAAANVYLTTGGPLAVINYSATGQSRWVVWSCGSEYGGRSALGASGHLSLTGHYQTGACFGGIGLASYYVSGVGAESFYLAQLGPALPLTATQLPAVSQPLALYPLPAHEAVQLPALPAGTQLTLLDALGRAIWVKPASRQLPLFGLAPGLYHLRATAPNGSQWASQLQVN